MDEKDKEAKGQVNTRDRICESCSAPFYDRQATTIRQKYCSHGCAGKARHEAQVSKYPPRDEIAALYAQGMTERAVGRHYGHTYTWAMTVRRFYGIQAGPKWKSKPVTQLRDRARWGMHRKPEKHCRNCGTSGRLDLHHAIPRSMSKAAKYDLRNGIPLCDRCHMGWHLKRIVISRDVFRSEEWAYLTSVKLVDRETMPWLDKHYPPKLQVAA